LAPSSRKKGGTLGFQTRRGEADRKLEKDYEQIEESLQADVPPRIFESH